MRPVGAIVLGAYIDHHGRRKGLILTLTLMTIGTACVALVPRYATIGVLAPVIVLGGRLVAGLLGGRGTGRRLGVSVRDRDQGQQGLLLLVAVGQSAVAVVFAALIGVVMNRRRPSK